MTDLPTEEDKFVDEYINGLKWSEHATAHEKTLVNGNIRGFYGALKDRSATTESILRGYAEEVCGLQSTIKDMQNQINNLTDQRYELYQALNDIAYPKLNGETPVSIAIKALNDKLKGLVK